MTDSRGFQWKVALILFGVLFLGVSDTQLVPPLLPLIARDLGVTPGRAGVLVSALGSKVVRATTHLDVSCADCEQAAEAIRALKP